jgi:hypothetical protein
MPPGWSILGVSSLIRSIYRSVFGPYLGIEIPFLGQTKCRIMEKDPTDRSVPLMRSKYIDAPSLGAEYGKNRKTDFFHL